MKGLMFQGIYKKIFSESIIQAQINFLFVSFIFLFGLKYDYLEIRLLFIILIIPCCLKVIKDCINKNFRNLIIFFLFLIVLLSHSLLNIYFEGSKITAYNLLGIFFLLCIFVIAFYFYENFNKNIFEIIKFFLLIFFCSVILSLFNFKNDAPFFCGGIPDIFGIFTSYKEYLPDGGFKVNNLLTSEYNRIGEIKISFKEYLFLENSHLGMIAPSIIIYLVHINFNKNINLFFKIIIYLFILICVIKSSTTFLLGTIASLIVLISLNFKNIPKNTLIAFSGILIIFSLILISSKECRARFVPIYSSDYNSGIDNTQNSKEIEPVAGINSEVAINLKNVMRTVGNLSSAVYFHALLVAKNSIVEKPFGWGVNRYDIAFDYFTAKNPSKVKKVNFMNRKDGSNNFIKMIVELGVFALILYFFIFLFLINKKIPLEYKLFYLPIVVTQSLRGAGYFNGGFSLIIFLMLFTYIKLNKKNL